METYLYSYEAVISMLSESFRAGERETGGILIGPDDNTRIITDALISSPFAERQPCTYCQNEEDTEILNTILRREFQSKGFDYRGDFHRHPRGMSHLSQGDLMTCRDILNNPDYKIGNSLVMNVITEGENNGLPIFSYVVSLGSKEEVIVKPIRIRLFPKKHLVELREFINCSYFGRTGGSDEGNNLKQSDRAAKDSSPASPFRDSE